MSRKSNRRDFLFGRAAADALADAAGAGLGAEASGSSGRAAGPGYLIRVARRAMAGSFEVCLNAGQHEHGTESALAALDVVESLERQMSVFQPDSEISRINRTAADGPVEVEPRLFALLELAMLLHRETQGTFDVTAGPLSEVWGFAHRTAVVPTEAQLAEALPRVGGHLVELDAGRRTVRFTRPGVQLNLGSIGKGYALDRCAERLRQAGIADFLLHGGHSSVLAGGLPRQPREATPGLAPGWRVGLRHPLRLDQRLAEIRLADRALATSGARTQSFVRGGRRYGHILDPRTGRPAEGIFSTTVIAPDAALADALSTALHVMGPEAAMDYCQTRPEIAAVLVCPAPRSGGFEVRTAGLAEDDLRLV